MDYKLKIGEREIEAEVGELALEAAVDCTIGAAAHAVTLRSSTAATACLTVDGRREVLAYARCREGTWVWSRGRARLVQDASRVSRGAGGGPAGGGAVTPLTPGVVVDVLVAVGDVVTAGQGLVVVSAMKMESTLTAGHDGTVTAINTEAGAKVMPGDILVDVEPTAADGEGGQE